MISAKKALQRYASQLVLIALVLLVYLPTLDHGFVWDDHYIIVNNPVLESLANIPSFFLSEDTIEESTGYYRPMTYVTFALEHAVWGRNPLGYHLTNLLLHICVVLLFRSVVLALFARERLACCAALVLALHPIAGETVNFLSGGRNTLLAACFALLAFLCYLGNRQLPALVFFTLGIFSKEFALLLPVIVLIYDVRLRREKIPWRRYLPYLVPVVAYLALRAYSVQKANFLATLNLSDAMKAPYLVVRYTWNMLFPFQLKVLYGVNPGTLAAAGCLALLVVMLSVVYYFKKNDAVLLSATWFFIFLLPVINIIPLNTTTQMADRYAYFSLMGFALLLACLVCQVRSRFATAGAVILCAAYCGVNVSRNGSWKSDIEFFTTMTKDAPQRFAGFKNLGMSYYKEGDTARALKYLATADAKPDITLNYLIGDAYIFWKENALEQAEKSLFKALQLEPYNPEPYMILMMISEQKGDPALAQSYRDKAKGLVNGIEEILANRAVDLCRAGEKYIARNQFKDAEVYLWQALKVNPRYVPALVDMGSLKARLGDFAAAESYLGQALALDPLNLPARYNLALMYQMQGRHVEYQREMAKYREAAIATKVNNDAAPR